MKNYNRLPLFLLLATTLVSCLQENPRDQLYEEDIYNNATDIYVNAVAVLYNYIGGATDSEGLQGTCRGIYDYNTLTTDEAMIPIRGGDWYDGGLWDNMYQHKWSERVSERALWSQWNRSSRGECMAVSEDMTKFGRNEAVLEAAGIAVTMDSER